MISGHICGLALLLLPRALLRKCYTQEKTQVYEKLYEGASQPKIEAATGVPQQTVSRWINEFVEAGLVTPPNEYSKNYRALFTLRELAINTTELAKRKKKEQAVVIGEVAR